MRSMKMLLDYIKYYFYLKKTMTQEEYREEYKKINKRWNDSVSIYKDIVSSLITSDTIVLEAGCGFSNLYREEYKRAKKIIGVDISEEYLNMNDIIEEKIVSDLSSFPQVPDNSVDLIISSWVIEHLESPDIVFSEFSRVLRKDGKIVFITPNALNYIVILNKIIPHWFRVMVASKLGGKLTVEPMKTFYRANSVSKIKSLAKNNNLSIDKLILNGDPTYVAINKVFYYLGILIEIILGLPILSNTKVHMIGVLKKS